MLIYTFVNTNVVHNNNVRNYIEVFISSYNTVPSSAFLLAAFTAELNIYVD